MKRAVFLIACVLLSGCEWDARRENVMLEEENEQLRLQLNLSTQYIEDVTQIIDEVQRNLQRIRDREGIIDKISFTTEGRSTGAVNVRKEVMTSISDIDSYIRDNREKMELLAERIKESQVRIGSLEKMVENLQVAVKQKEDDIAALKTKISSLEANVANLEGQIVAKEAEIQTQSKTISEQAQAIEDREAVIREQELAASTAYYVVDTRDELKRKGLILEKRSGFLGLGKTTMVGTIADTFFAPVRKSETNIPLNPDVKDIEIVSAHKQRPDLYSFKHSTEGAELTINDTSGFWALSGYLIIVASD
ncbi:MAG: hypothetical protein PVF33_14005 [Candidatus Latescibacterota bacterium]